MTKIERLGNKCTNPDSDHIADCVDAEDWCNEWEGAVK